MQYAGALTVADPAESFIGGSAMERPFDKRVDLRLETGFRIRGKRVVRGTAHVGKRSVSIEYREQLYKTWDQLKEEIPHLRAVGSGDRELREILEKAGFRTEDVEARHGSLHVTVNVKLLDLIQDEAQERGITVSKVVTEALNKHYKTKF